MDAGNFARSKSRGRGAISDVPRISQRRVNSADNNISAHKPPATSLASNHPISMPVPAQPHFSILDLAPVRQCGTVAEALRNTLDVAQHAERWGFKRFWLS